MLLMATPTTTRQEVIFSRRSTSSNLQIYTLVLIKVYANKYMLIKVYANKSIMTHIVKRVRDDNDAMNADHGHK